MRKELSMAIKILLAEDDIQLVDMYSRKFELDGFETVIAEDGQKAIDTFEGGFVPDIAVLDVMMPMVNGLEVLKYIKDNEKLRDIIVVMLTNLSDEKTAETIYELGATEYLVKAEFTPLEVSNKIKELIKFYKK